MQLVRNKKLPACIKNTCPVPVATENSNNKNGIFLALAGANDLPGFHVSADLNFLLKHGRVWVGKAGTLPDWVEITKRCDLPAFKSCIVDNYESCSFGIFVTPYMPQFFWVPNNTMRGNRLFKKLK